MLFLVWSIAVIVSYNYILFTAWKFESERFGLKINNELC